MAIQLCGVTSGAVGAVHLPETIAKTCLGVLTISLGIYSWSNKSLGQTSLAANRHRQGLWLGGAVIFIIGLLNGALASGTGLFVTLWLIRWFGLDYKQAVAYTMILVGLFWNGSGAIAVNSLSPAQWNWLPALIAGSLLGGYAGTHIAILKGNGFIKKMFEVLTLASGLWLLWNAWAQPFHT
ncbi:MAG TPA: sulfite exporter TauE/SafE family protein [Cellvibrionaceae bacterium]|nr:sulfite exporter TauE/SafE family protein [Cellvibrionaceae bacterium]